MSSLFLPFLITFTFFFEQFSIVSDDFYQVDTFFNRYHNLPQVSLLYLIYQSITVNSKYNSNNINSNRYLFPSLIKD